MTETVNMIGIWKESTAEGVTSLLTKLNITMKSEIAFMKARSLQILIIVKRVTEIIPEANGIPLTLELLVTNHLFDAVSQTKHLCQQTWMIAHMFAI